MPLSKDAVIWLTDKYGIALDEYEGKIKLQGVTKYQKGGEDVLTWDWIYRATWNKDTKTREVPAKANGVAGVSLGSRDEAVQTLSSLLRRLGAGNPPKPVEEDSEIPF